jgi:hypothetical protein
VGARQAFMQKVARAVADYWRASASKVPAQQIATGSGGPALGSAR